MTATENLPPHAIRRVRQETRRRRLEVVEASLITPRMKRIVLSGDMDGFVSLGADDHIKLFFAAADGTAEMRDFTPRAFDVAAGTLTVDFALHEAGPAAEWATAARIGDMLDLGGPRGSAIVPHDFDWYWLIGDETALPAIGRFVEELPQGAKVTTAVAIADAGERQSFAAKADWAPLWTERDTAGADDAAALLALLDARPFPPGDGYIFVAAESSVARAIRARLLERGHPRAQMKAAGYWTRGLADAHERIED